MAKGGIPGYTYEWSTGALGTSAKLYPGTHYVTATDNEGRTATKAVEIRDDMNAPIADAGSQNQLDCAQSILTLDGSASSNGPVYEIQWFTANGNILTGENGLTPTINAPGTYCIEVTNLSNYCKASNCIEIGIDTIPPMLDLGEDQTLNCHQSTVTLTGNPSSNIDSHWSGPFGFSSNQPSITVSDSGLYSLTIIDLDNGCSISDAVYIDKIPTPTISLINYTNVLCFGDSTGSILVTANGGVQPYSYSWSTNQTSPEIENLIAGTYSLTLTDFEGCEDTISIDLTQPLEIRLNITATNESTLGSNDGMARVDPIGGVPPFTFKWSNDSTFQEISNLSPGNYIVTVTDTNGCTKTGSIIIEQGTVHTTDLALFNNIILFPNPNKGIFKLAFSFSKNHMVQYSIHDAIGKLIHSNEEESFKENIYTIDILNQSSGVYFLRIQIDRDLIGYKRVVVLN